MAPNDQIVTDEQAASATYDKSGRPIFFSDPAIDRLISVILQLTSEVWVLAERVETIEQLAQKKGQVTYDEIKNYAPDPDESRIRDEKRDRFVQSVLGPLREVRR
jgi:hypothetical protein